MYTADNIPKIFYGTQFQDQIKRKLSLTIFLFCFAFFPLKKIYLPTNGIKLSTQEKCADLFLFTENMFWNEVDSYR